MDFEGISLRRKFLHGLEPDNVHMMIGIYRICFIFSNIFTNFIQINVCINYAMVNFAIFILNVGSMTIDCLGMLTELSDCERKLFPIGYQ